ncbi:hypothetical protein FA09DRAFT_172517 [Tilletiopsis washingtonensis]|uniref:Uncharacterized protein n=1 Tax=Tilletiopsis washingtonensis TaxID=58919 RepID=A0A316Z3C4_9BASI|nr:hypothetical protein FA09DRAFT_172517 [Tilletiopsis washingtonensis]PWN94675.1 hypothetical protein FA09DRAFT_172517 [Tilletiopsis washingtonensis]
MEDEVATSPYSSAARRARPSTPRVARGRGAASPGAPHPAGSRHSAREFSLSPSQQPLRHKLAFAGVGKARRLRQGLSAWPAERFSRA